QQAVDAIDAAVVRAELALQVEAVLRGRAAFQITQADGVDLDVDDRLAGHRRHRASDDADLDHAYVGRVTGPVILLLASFVVVGHGDIAGQVGVKQVSAGRKV